MDAGANRCCADDEGKGLTNLEKEGYITRAKGT